MNGSKSAKYLLQLLNSFFIIESAFLKCSRVFEEKITGQAEVREIFKVSKVGTIAGSYVTSGSIVRSGGVRLIRDSIVIYTGRMAGLRRFKDDVKEVKAGYECGITIENYNDIKVGDVIECFVMEEAERE